MYEKDVDTQWLLNLYGEGYRNCAVECPDSSNLQRHLSGLLNVIENCQPHKIRRSRK